LVSNPKSAALEGYHALFRGDRVIVHGWANWILTSIHGILPLEVQLSLFKYLMS